MCSIRFTCSSSLTVADVKERLQTYAKIPVRNFVMFMFFSGIVQVTEHSQKDEENLGSRVKQVRYSFVLFQL
jgi:hypothetical protein